MAMVEGISSLKSLLMADKELHYGSYSTSLKIGSSFQSVSSLSIIKVDFSIAITPLRSTAKTDYITLGIDERLISADYNIHSSVCPRLPS